MRRITLLVLAVLLLGCQQRIEDYSQYTGTTGLEVSLAPGAPPNEVYEGYPVPVKVEVHNTGALPVTYDKMLITFSADPLYLGGGVVQLEPAKADLSGSLIQGRSLSYLDGETRPFSVPAKDAFVAKEVPGTLQRPTATVTASVCYAYTTHLATEVCVDANIYQENRRAQPCRATDLAFAGGQGAPVAITAVDVEAFPSYDDITGTEVARPFFTIHVKDMQGGLLATDTIEMKYACLLKDIPRDELGAVKVTAWLLDEQLECRPEIVKLYDGEGETQCVSAGITTAQNFLTTLTVNATYLYKSSASADVAIKRSRVPTATPGEAKVDGYVYDGDIVRIGPDGKPVTVCDTYAANPPSGLEEYLRKDSSCACSRDECTKILGNGGACVFKGGVCPSPLFCCSSSPPAEAPAA